MHQGLRLAELHQSCQSLIVCVQGEPIADDKKVLFINSFSPSIILHSPPVGNFGH